MAPSSATAPTPVDVDEAGCLKTAVVAGLTTGSGERLMDPTGARLAAVVHLDMVGYSRLMGLDEAGTFTRLRDVFENVLPPLAAQGSGRVANTAGDSALLVFPGAGAAVRFALAFQQAVSAREAARAVDQAMRFRIGVTVAEVLEAGGANVHGDGVNVAARLQAACPPGTVCVSRALRDQVQDRLGDVTFEAMGTLALKNIARPVEAYVARALSDGAASRRWQGISRCLRRSSRAGGQATLAAVALIAGGLAAWTALYRMPPTAGAFQAAAALPDLSIKHAPRLSFVVLPFANTSGDAGQDYLADAVTDDLTTDLARMDGAFVIGRGSAQTYRGRAVDARRVGAELGVRYLVQGSMRRIGEGMVRVNAELVSTETGEGLWVERFDQEVSDLGQGQGQGDIVRRLAGSLGTRMVAAESARGLRERPDNPDAFDLVLRARSSLSRIRDRAHVLEAQALYEKALVLDPNATAAMIGLAVVLVLEAGLLNEPRPDGLQRAEALLQAAQKINPVAPDFLEAQALLLFGQERYEAALAAYGRVIAEDPNAATSYSQSAICYMRLGRPQDAIPLVREAMRRDPRNPVAWVRYNVMGRALLRLRRPEEAAGWLRRALDENPARGERSSLGDRLYFSSALALSGEVKQARREVAELLALDPFSTVRSFETRSDWMSPEVSQRRYVAEGLRMAGLRDHVEEDVDAGVPSTGELHQEAFGPTPMTVPGAATVRTEDVRRMLADVPLLVLDLNGTGRSLPGAVVLGHAFTGGSLGDALQDRLRRKLQALTSGDAERPIIVLGWNAERWGSRNVALRLVALGYTRVHWYRGGKEVWEAQGLPEVEADVQEW